MSGGAPDEGDAGEKGEDAQFAERAFERAGGEGPAGARAAGSGGRGGADGDGLPDPAQGAARGRGAPADPGEAPVAHAGEAARRLRHPEVVLVALVCTVATIFFGIYPSPLLDVAGDAGAALTNLL